MSTTYVVVEVNKTFGVPLQLAVVDERDSTEEPRLAVEGGSEPEPGAVDPDAAAWLDCLELALKNDVDALGFPI
jgi:hypothetical protein